MEKESNVFELSISRLIPVAIFYWLSAAAALLGLFSFDPQAFLGMMFQAGVVQYSAVQTWGVLFALVGLMALIWPAVAAFCLTACVAKRPGFSMLAKILDVFNKAIQIARWALIGYFAYRFIRYVILCFSQDLVVYLIMSMLLFEGALGAACYFFLQMLIKFSSDAADACTNLSYIQHSGKPTSGGSHTRTVRVLIVLGLLGAAIGIYLFIFPFVSGLCVASLLLTAIANIVLAILLKSCQARISYEAYRLAKQKQYLDQPER